MSWVCLEWSESVEMKRSDNDEVRCDLSTARLVLVILARMAGDCGHAWPSLKTLGEITMRTPRSLQDVMGWLDARFYVGRFHRNQYGARERSNLYELYAPGRWFIPSCPACQEMGFKPDTYPPYVPPPLAERPRVSHPSAQRNAQRNTSSVEQRNTSSVEPYLIENPKDKDPVENNATLAASPAPEPGWPAILSERIPIFRMAPLTVEQVKRIETDYKGVDFLREARRYTDWHLDHMNRIPTRNGRMNSLRNWLERADRRGSNPATSNGSRAAAPDPDELVEAYLFTDDSGTTLVPVGRKPRREVDPMTEAWHPAEPTPQMGNGGVMVVAHKGRWRPQAQAALSESAGAR